MARFPYRTRRRGKGASRKGNENTDATDNADNFRQKDQSEAKSNSEQSIEHGEKRHQNFGDQSKHNGSFSKRNSSKSLSGKPFDNKRMDNMRSENSDRPFIKGDDFSDAPMANATDTSHSLDKQVGKRRGKGSAQAGQLRNMRAPVKPAPDASLVDKQPDEIKNQHTSNKPNNNKRNRHGGNQRLYAALDLGTNNCRLLVAVAQEKGRFRVIDGFSKIVRLGEGLTHTGKLSDDAMDRAVDALKVCATKLKNHNIRLKRLIATEACRQASNGDLFLERVEKETGLKLEVINRETEARLAAEGCGALIDKKTDAGVLFDIGGGSTELILVNRRTGRKRISNQIVAWTSLPVGVVTLAERYGGTLVTRDVFKKMVSEVRTMLETFEGRNALGKLWKNGRVHLLGTSGTVTTLAGIHLKLSRYDRRLVDGLWLTDKEIDAVLESLLGMNYQQRAASPCIGKERADLVMAGCAILEAIRITWPAKRLRVADRGLREGILTQLMDNDGAWVRPKKGRWPRKRNNSSKKSSSGTVGAGE